MSQPQTRRLPRLAPLALPDLGRPDVRARLGPACGILLLLLLLTWAVGEYAGHRTALREAETNRYLAAFRAPPVHGAWRRLSAAWQAGQDRQNVLLARLAEPSGGGAGSALRNYRQFVLETIEEHHLPVDIETVRRFFEGLAVCIRVGNCDREVAAAHLRPALRQFRNQHYYYFEAEGTAAELDRVVAQITPDAPGVQALPAAP